MKPHSDKTWFGMILLLSLIVRMAIFSMVAAQPLKYYSDSDAYSYEIIALNLFQHGRFSQATQPPLTPDIYRTPVYPVMLAGIYAITHESAASMIILQILIGSFAAALTYLLAINLNLPRQYGVIAAIIVIFDPLTVLTTYQLLTETIFTTFLIAGMLLLSLYWKNSHTSLLALASVFIAAAALTRPIGQFLPIAVLPVFGMVLWQKRQPWKQISLQIFLFLALSLLMIQAWAYRNYHEADIWTLSAISEKNLLYYRGSYVLALARNISRDEAGQELKKYMQDQIHAENLSEAQSIALMRKKALEIFVQYPKQTFMVHASGLVRVLINPGLDLICIMLNQQGNISGCAAENAESFLDRITEKLSNMSTFQKAVATWSILLLLAVYAGAAIGIWVLFRQNNRIALMLLIILIAYFSLLSAGGESVSRFRIPFLPFLAILASAGLVNIFNFLRGNSFHIFSLNKKQSS